VEHEGRREGGLVVWRERKGREGEARRITGDEVKAFGGKLYLRVHLHCE